MFILLFVPRTDQVNKHEIISISFKKNYFQTVTFEVLNMNYTIDPRYGNFSKLPDNSTHLGERTFWFQKDILLFTVSLMNSRIFVLFLKFFTQFTHQITYLSGEKVYASTISPCKKTKSKFGDLMRLALNIDKSQPIQEIIPFLWICPIKKAIIVLKFSFDFI